MDTWVSSHCAQGHAPHYCPSYYYFVLFLQLPLSDAVQRMRQSHVPVNDKTEIMHWRHRAVLPK